MKDKILIRSGLLLMIILLVIMFMETIKRPTREEVAAMCNSIIRTDSMAVSIFHIRNALKMESYILAQGLVLTGDMDPVILYPYIYWLVEREEMRMREENRKRRKR